MNNIDQIFPFIVPIAFNVIKIVLTSFQNDQQMKFGMTSFIFTQYMHISSRFKENPKKAKTKKDICKICLSEALNL